jgi:hypothetical protein
VKKTSPAKVTWGGYGDLSGAEVLPFVQDDRVGARAKARNTNNRFDLREHLQSEHHVFDFSHVFFPARCAPIPA